VLAAFGSQEFRKEDNKLLVITIYIVYDQGNKASKLQSIYTHVHSLSPHPLLIVLHSQSQREGSQQLNGQQPPIAVLYVHFPRVVTAQGEGC